MNSSGLNPARTGPARAEARPRARAPALVDLHKGPRYFEYPEAGHNTIPGVADISQKSPCTSISSRFEVPDGERRRVMLWRPTLAETEFKTHRSFPLTQFY